MRRASVCLAVLGLFAFAIPAVASAEITASITKFKAKAIPVPKPGGGSSCWKCHERSRLLARSRRRKPRRSATARHGITISFHACAAFTPRPYYLRSLIRRNRPPGRAFR